MKALRLPFLRTADEFLSRGGVPCMQTGHKGAKGANKQNVFSELSARLPQRSKKEIKSKHF